MNNIHIFTDTHMLADYAAGLFIEAAQTAINAHHRFSAALSGGSTPRQLYARLAQSDLVSRVNWDAVHLFWGDERCVPPDHPDSNYRMVRESLRVPIPEENIHRIHGELASELAAEEYENKLRSFFTETPRFDLILLGMGEDGHTASLFADSPALKESARWAVAVAHETPPPPLVPRVSLTLPVINNAQDIVFLVNGAGKASRLAEILNEPEKNNGLPAQAVRPNDGELHWLVDTTAAARLHVNL